MREQDERDRDAYQFLRDDVIPQVLNQLQVPEDERDLITGSIQYLWSTLPDNLRSNNPRLQNSLARKAARAINEFGAYNNGQQIDPSGFSGWLVDRIPFDETVRDFIRTDFNPNVTSGTTFAAYAMSGLSPREFAGMVIEPLASARGSLSPGDFRLLMGGIINFEDKNGFPPSENDIRNLVSQVVR